MKLGPGPGFSGGGGSKYSGEENRIPYKYLYCHMSIISQSIQEVKVTSH